MKTIEIVGFNRSKLGKTESKHLRENGNVPCNLYGSKGNVTFYAPMFLFKDLVYTPNAYMVDLNIEGTVYRSILQEIQYHPVSEVIMHADFLYVGDGQPIVMNIPLKIVGTAVGITKGGKLAMKVRKVKVQATPENMPDFVEVNVENLDLGQSIKIGHIKQENFKIMANMSIPVASILIPRAVKQQQGK